MRYIAVKWQHNSKDYPIEMFSEIDDARWEQRKVEVYADGRTDYASEEIKTGSTELGQTPIPTLGEIAADRQFEPREITKPEFELVWKNAIGS